MSSESSGKGSDQGTPRKQLKDYPGKDISEIPESERCCCQYLWVKKDGTSVCWKYAAGKHCPNGKHLTKPTEAMKGTKVFAKLKAERGAPNVPAKGPKPPVKAESAASE